MNIYLGLGSNLGDRESHLVEAKDLLMKHNVMVLGQSEVRETKPLGGKDQPDYLNQVIEVVTELSPEALLTVCKQVEAEMGRPVAIPGMVTLGAPKEERWASRIIDIDILVYGDVHMNTPQLTIPHPGVQERDFVQEGLKDLGFVVE